MKESKGELIVKVSLVASNALQDVMYVLEGGGMPRDEQSRSRA